MIEVEMPGQRAKRYTVSSRISLQPTAEDDYADYTCAARHEALPDDMPLRTTVQLSVLCEFTKTSKHTYIPKALAPLFIHTTSVYVILSYK